MTDTLVIAIGVVAVLGLAFVVVLVRPDLMPGLPAGLAKSRAFLRQHGALFGIDDADRVPLRGERDREAQRGREGAGSGGHAVAGADH